MRSALVGTQVKPQPDVGGREAAEISELLRLFGAAAPGAILLALAGGPLRTKDLTTRVPGYAPRTIYRYASKLGEIGAIEREEEPGVPSKVVHSLADPCGIELCELVDRFGRATLQALPGGEIVPHSWGSVTLLADLWESGMFKELIAGPCTATELARVSHDLSFHQVSRRINLFMIGGMLCEAEDGLKRRRYELTEQARRGVGLIAALGSWRERYAGAPGETGLTLGETADVVRAVVPLVVLPEHAGECFRLEVAQPGGNNGDEGEIVWLELDPEGRAVAYPGPLEQCDGWGHGEAGDWIEALVRGEAKVATGGTESAAVDDCLEEMQAALWTRAATPS
ncbi:MAG: winged helix-turn-helix transcriptional regulator [Solirubrobacterales bacterium]